MKYRQFVHFQCEFFPCHDLADWRSCIFCYCPLFLLHCPGPYAVLPSGMKDCSTCTIPHTGDGWDIIQRELAAQLFMPHAAAPSPHHQSP